MIPPIGANIEDQNYPIVPRVLRPIPNPLIPIPNPPILSELIVPTRIDICLGKDLQITILCFLAFRDLLNVRNTCKTFRKAAQSERLMSLELAGNVAIMSQAAGYLSKFAKFRFWPTLTPKDGREEIDPIHRLRLHLEAHPHLRTITALD